MAAPPLSLRRTADDDVDWARALYRETVEAPTVALLGTWRDQGMASEDEHKVHLVYERVEQL